MKKHLLMWLMLVLVGPAKSIDLHVTASETNGLVQFLMNCERRSEKNTLYSLLKNSTYNTEQTQQMLDDWNEVNRFNTLRFEGFPESRYNDVSVYDLLVVQSVRATSAADLAQRCSGFFRQADLKKLKAVLLYFEPVYRNLVWKPHQKTIGLSVKKLQAYVKNHNIDALFEKAAVFYGTGWDNSFPFYVMINPLPGQVYTTSARPMGQVLLADYALNEKDLPGWLGVVFHEMCHVLYKYQPAEKQEQLAQWMTTGSDTAYRLAAYNWLDETLATAVGNGWVVENIQQKADTSEWYNNPYINRYAHALYPLVKQYLEQNKTIDAGFASAATGTFAQNFKDINYDTQHLFTFMDIVSDSLPRESFNEVFKWFYPRAFGSQTPFGPEALSKAQSRTGTLIFVLNGRDNEKLALLREQFALETAQVSAPGIYYFLEQQGRNYFVLQLNSMNDFGKAMSLLGEQKKLSGKKGFIPMH